MLNNERDIYSNFYTTYVNDRWVMVWRRIEHNYFVLIDNIIIMHLLFHLLTNNLIYIIIIACVLHIIFLDLLLLYM